MRARVLLAVLLLAPGAARAQNAPRAASDRVLAEARLAQRRFEIDRLAGSRENDPGYAPCDEEIGRICLHHGEGADWYPGPEDERIVAGREALLDALAGAAAALPDDPWLLGQRVAYLGEAGRWGAADGLAADACARAPTDDRCHALRGLALHELGRFTDAESEFRLALARMDSADVRRWNDPEPVLDLAARSWWGRVPAADRARGFARIWALADPLLVVPGNDALTEYWARRTMARVRADARNGYGMSWGSDLEQMLLRYGWEIGWERIPPRPMEMGPTNAIGHHHPESRPLLPSAATLADPVAADAAAWIPEARQPRSGCAPAYAAVVLPDAGPIAVFPRGDRFVLVGAYALPEDTTYHAQHDHAARSVVHPAWRGQPTEAGLFAIGVGADSVTAGVRTTDGEEGGLMLEVPAGDWVGSLEVFAPELRRAGRTRIGLHLEARPPDVPTLSELLLVESALGEGAQLEDAADHARARDWIEAGESLAIAWELFGFGYRPETISYHLSVERAQQGLLGRVGRRLGLLRAPPRQRLEWEEEGPTGPGPVLRSVEIQLPSVAPGLYVIRLEITTPGRTPLERERRVELRP